MAMAGGFIGSLNARAKYKSYSSSKSYESSTQGISISPISLLFQH